MKLIGLLAFYEENPAWLHECVASLAEHGVDHLVAVDGAYALLPDGKAASHPDRHAAIHDAARGIGLTLHVPSLVWAGNEVEKRTFMFRLGQRLATPRRDWYWVMDSDQVVHRMPSSTRSWLEQTERDDAEVTFWEPERPGSPKVAKDCFPLRVLFRAIPGLRCEHNHYTYVVPDGRKLWGNATISPIEEALALHGLVIEHRTRWRDDDRRKQQVAFYRTRFDQRVELGKCDRCEADAVTTVAGGWELTPAGLAAGWAEACDFHADEIQREGERLIRRLGFDPKDVRLAKHHLNRLRLPAPAPRA